MSEIKANQTAARLILQTNVNFNTTTPKTLLIKYKKPDGTTGSWTGAVLSGSETTGKVYVDFTTAIKFDLKGKWSFWVHMTLTDDTVAFGDVVSYEVKAEGV